MGKLLTLVRASTWILPLTLTLSLAAGCGEASDPRSSDTDPYAAEIKAAARGARSEFERQVMSDGKITRREYEETVQRAVTCARDRGVEVNVITRYGINQYEVIGDEEGVFDQCSDTYLGVIEALYSSTVMNPQKEDIFDLTAECLRKSGLADESFTGEDFKSIVIPGGTDGSRGVSGAFPFDESDPRFEACSINPAQASTQVP